MKTLLVFLVLVSSALAQERPLPSVAGINVTADYMNASSLDGMTAVLPSPSGLESVLYFDLGYSLPSNTPISINVYGDIPAGSNLFLGAIYEGMNEGFSHRCKTSHVEYLGTKPNDKPIRVVQSWAFPVRYLCLLRDYYRTPDVINLDGSITLGKTTYENGLDCRIDCIAEVPQPKPVYDWKAHYSRFVINSSLFGKSLKK